jgi:TldD protein
LRHVAPLLEATVTSLKARYDYISVLGTDSIGMNYSASAGELRAGDSSWIERGFVFRAQKSGVIVERAFNGLPPGDSLADTVADALDALFSTANAATHYPALPDEKARAEYFGTAKIEPFSADPDLMLAKLAAARDALLAVSPEIVYAAARAEFMQVAKLFISPERRLEQSFYWAQGYLVGVAKRGELTREDYQSFSGLKGAELADEVLPAVPAFANELLELLDAGSIEPGEYEVIMDPDVTGTLAHEAFGHGVETDMFVKGRAKAPAYLGKPVASPIVQMFDGAAAAAHCGSYLFDDEGRLATATQIIKDGILLAGISDLQSALILGSAPTGNGRRQAYDHKAYARMTNTYIASGSDSYTDMLASVKHGWLLQKMNSGMEDPKNWGIQLVVLLGREIVDGALSGRVVSPVVCSGYVPEVLSNISMISKDFELSGSGYCGKGYKEYVKVSAGGPYVKTRMRLG